MVPGGRRGARAAARGQQTVKQAGTRNRGSQLWTNQLPKKCTRNPPSSLAAQGQAARYHQTTLRSCRSAPAPQSLWGSRQIIVRERVRRLLEQLFLTGHLLWAARYSFLKDSLQNCTEMFLHALSFAHKTRLFLATCTARQPRALI